MKGHFIAFEGANGVGKSTIIKKIYDRLCFEGREIVLTKEPSNTKMGLLSREIANEIAGKSLACLVASD